MDGRIGRQVEKEKEFTCSGGAAVRSVLGVQGGPSYTSSLCVILRGDGEAATLALIPGWKRGKDDELGVKMATWSKLRPVSLPSPVSPQPPLSVLPQPVVFQSIGIQPSSQCACAMPRPLTTSAPPSLPSPFLSSLSSVFVPAPSLPPCSH